ncbi:hypothetical protein BX616_002671 [Lobosporangium transversale]|uniref:Uncharacterized protein n=1 Tax=Lobosporangium transversale TaxID=64571 RepID=A0A1Y2GAU2_9FUNG|nr:hypothetical protein BCR41DRAFT_361353 [Lobosporangium transversale]KAF9916841.1 hypothetical protein BX616_002671 [Lobosporangium transversale]ORZ05867.1 hypothetical protein BCR41DRAFT_361353 [Lobosporangium transversale]|eukprot:XP_021877248.1 hypothetical protein BCR41DRAFT_361353 [Lobosporangium transversale]
MTASRTIKLSLFVFLFSTAIQPAITQGVPDPIIETCLSVGCSTTAKLLEPCGGGATNSSLQQNFVYTVTPVLGSCECNSQFFNAFSQCLSCIASQAKSRPTIDNQQNWVADCKTYGFNFTNEPLPNYVAPIGGPDPSKGGLAGGAIAGIVIAVLAAVGAIAAGFFLFRNKRRRTKGGIFERPYSAANTDNDGYESTPSQPSFNTYTNYNNAGYPDNHNYSGGYSDDPDQSYYNNNNYNNNFNQQQQLYSSGQNDEPIMMENLQHSTYISPPAPMTNEAVAAVTAAAGGTSGLSPLGSPRPSDQYPQSLRSKNNIWGENRQHEYSSDLVSTNQALHNDKAVYDEAEELEPPRARDRFQNDRDDYTNRRSLTPPRANMQSYRDEFQRPSFDREPRRNSGSERGSVTGLNLTSRPIPSGLASGPITGYDSNDEDSPENARRRRAAELFSAEGTRR